MARLATGAAGAAPLTGDENDPKMQMTILLQYLECLDSRVKSNPVFSAAIILASLMESYYRYCTDFVLDFEKVGSDRLSYSTVYPRVSSQFFESSTERESH
jgi:hypothetical protein